MVFGMIRIGITTSEFPVIVQDLKDKFHSSKEGPFRTAFPNTYIDAVVAAGALPVLLSPLPAKIAAQQIEGLDGLLLCGGPDINPRRYHQRRHVISNVANAEAENTELLLLRQAQKKDLPVLAICRGLQLLNVASGGSLIQHMPDHPELSPTHQKLEGSPLLHKVQLTGSLKKMYGTKNVLTNSHHHQAIDFLGENLAVLAEAQDGIIEAVASTIHPILAVQWHPEITNDGQTAHSGLFEWLIKAV
jgi:putative glutamine amidotransferase